MMGALNEKILAAVLAHEDTNLSPPATVKAIDAFEKKHNFRFPLSHREFLLQGNGGEVGYARLFGVGESDHMSLEWHVTEMRPELESMAQGPVMPFANDWGGSYFCYDLQKADSNGEYPVLFWNHEYSEEPEDLPLVWSDFAANFVEFLQKIIS
ncbi:SMI1/KNR4 family protein [Gimesia fumaroli]|uniref:SMI1 / KNR4 family protein n=1 Tax=Gimesia fumaroli TaxID=2527976 RepID=A0A518ID27_9PLAN|nr:SMI1/KNR4 family protein [Gimesia fumaroli]QDV51011.1 SMI1 / KNR4 family protein [Gimesia fumaroli]